MSAAVTPGSFFMYGDHACAAGAVYAGCRFFAGYPITPATEIAEYMARNLPRIGGTYIQMEDEIASITSVLGASAAGVKAMTATSGPGFSLMMENIGLGVMMELPCVIVNVQRGGPSTGLPTLPGQQDMMQVRWGSHGDYSIIAYSPESPQEAFEVTVMAFNSAERYRVPTFVMTDEIVGHMRERVVIPEEGEIPSVDRRLTTRPPDEYQPYAPDGDLVPPMAIAGSGYHVRMTGLTHDHLGRASTIAETQAELVPRLKAKVEENRDDIVKVSTYMLEDAEYAFLAYGITARCARYVVELARKEGVKVGLFRPVTVWPFPEREVRDLGEQVRAVLVPEMNLGQIVREVERCVRGAARVVSIPHAGGALHRPEDLFAHLRKVMA